MVSSKAGRLSTARGLSPVVQVCETCNTHWMSDLEGRSRALLGEVVTGRHATFDPTALAIIGHWASKTAMMLQPAPSPHA